MKIPLDDSATDLMRFGLDPSRRKWSMLTILIGCLIAGFCLAFGGSGVSLPVILGAAVVAAGAGVVLAASKDSVDVDPRARTFRTTKGIWPIFKRRDYELAEFDQLILEVIPATDAYGEERLSKTLYLAGGTRRISLFENWDSPETDAATNHIACALGRPTPGESVVLTRHGPMVQRSVTYGAWCCMTCLAVFMLWPKPSSSNPPSLPHGLPSMSSAFRGRDSRFDQGLYLYRAGQFAGAENVFREMLDRDSNNGEILNMLAYAVAEQGRKEEALKIARRALSASPNNWMIVDTVAEMHQRRGEYPVAARYYREALKYPESQRASETHCKYGETLLELGRRKEAIEHLRQSANGFEPAWAERARRRLSALGTL